MPRGVYERKPKNVAEEKKVETVKKGRGRPAKTEPAEKPKMTILDITPKKEETDIPKETPKKVFKNGMVAVIIDMQNDFIDGSLANPAAQKIVSPICEFIKKAQCDILFTQDTHHEDYLNTFEGKRLPVPHCIDETEGWKINKKLIKATEESGRAVSTAMKFYFGDGENIADRIEKEFGIPKYIYLLGTCTDICVVSNALQLRSIYPDATIVVYEDLCAGLTPEAHKAALTVMKNCQIDVLKYCGKKK